LIPFETKANKSVHIEIRVSIFEIIVRNHFSEIFKRYISYGININHPDIASSLLRTCNNFASSKTLVRKSVVIKKRV
jgi:hypothetical protein